VTKPYGIKSKEQIWKNGRVASLVTLIANEGMMVYFWTTNGLLVITTSMNECITLKRCNGFHWNSNELSCESINVITSKFNCFNSKVELHVLNIHVGY
jgi:hypothetical protein